MSRKRHSTGRHRKKHDEHTNHEAWAIPYGDLVTLLLAFFVVMYAISSVNAGKYRVLSDSLFAAFRGAPRTLEPIQVGDKQVGTGADLHTTVIQQAMLDGKAQSKLAPVPISVGLAKSASTAASGQLPAQAVAAAAALSRVADQVAQAMDQLVKKDLVTIRRNDFWIEVEMRTDILFPSGSARLADDAVSIIERLGDVLSPFPNPIRVEGHTDNRPIKTAVFYSNWELSAARAGSVVRVLATHGVSPDRLAVIGYGEQRPIKANDTPDGRNANRRVVVVILSTDLVRAPASPSNAGSTDPGSLVPSATGAGAPTTVGASTTVGDPTTVGAPTAIGAPTAVGAPTVAPDPAALPAVPHAAPAETAVPTQTALPVPASVPGAAPVTSAAPSPSPAPSL